MARKGAKTFQVHRLFRLFAPLRETLPFLLFWHRFETLLQRGSLAACEGSLAIWGQRWCGARTLSRIRMRDFAAREACASTSNPHSEKLRTTAARGECAGKWAVNSY